MCIKRLKKHVRALCIENETKTRNASKTGEKEACAHFVLRIKLKNHNANKQAEK